MGRVNSRSEHGRFFHRCGCTWVPPMAIFCSQSLQERSTELICEPQQFTSLNNNRLRSMYTQSAIFFFALHKEMDPVPTPMLVLHQFVSPKTVVSVMEKAGFRVGHKL